MWIAKAPSHDLLDPLQASADLLLQFRGITPLMRIVVSTDFSSNRHAGRYWKLQAGHLGKIRTLTAKQPVKPSIAIGFTAAKRVDVAFIASRPTMSVLLL